MIRTQAPEWGIGAAIGVGVFVAVFAGILGGVVLIGLWAMKNEELIRGNETGEPGAVDGWATLDDDEEVAVPTRRPRVPPGRGRTETAPSPGR